LINRATVEIWESVKVTRVLRAVLLFFGFLYIGSGQVMAATGEELKAVVEAMADADLNTTEVFTIVGRTIEHEGFHLVLDTGRLAFLKPVVIDGVPRVYGAMFEGKGRFQFTPQLRYEREQIRRFFKSDSLDASFERTALYFSQEIYDSLTAWGTPGAKPFGGKELRWMDGKIDEITKRENYGHLFLVLTGLMRPAERPYLMVDVEPEKYPPVRYWFDPDWSEEVSLSRELWEPGVRYMELISSYSQYDVAEYPHIGGHAKSRLRPIKYRTSGSIDRSGNYCGKAEMTVGFHDPTQLTPLTLHPELTVDSILDETETPVAFLRWTKRDNRSSPLYLFLNRVYQPDEKVVFKFFYQGKIAERFNGEFIVSAGADWYPRTSAQPHVDFDMTFYTPKDFAFVATGRNTMSETVDDTLMTRWQTIEPADNVTFTIGNMTRFEFGDEETGPIDIYYHKDVHLNRNRQKYVAEDIEGSLRLFERLFGEYAYPKTTVSEIFAYHGEAFPGFIHLGHEFWETDTWGAERILRSHEVAHQWWGVGVDYSSYHDQWLSEGFATYSSLMYYQAAYGQEKFTDKLREYRDRIFDVRKYLFIKGAESGPIILGYRTSSSKTEDDYSLVVYKKGALVLHMLRNMLLNLDTMKEDLFLRMMQEWYRDWRGKYATTADFQALTEKYTGIDMDWFFQQWVFGTELPTYKFDYDPVQDEDGRYRVKCRVKVEGVPEGFKMFMPVEIRLGENRKVYTRVMIDKLQQEFEIPGLPVKPVELIFNPFESVLCKVKN